MSHFITQQENQPLQHQQRSTLTHLWQHQNWEQGTLVWWITDVFKPPWYAEFLCFRTWKKNWVSKTWIAMAFMTWPRKNLKSNFMPNSLFRSQNQTLRVSAGIWVLSSLSPCSLPQLNSHTCNCSKANRLLYKYKRQTSTDLTFKAYEYQHTCLPLAHQFVWALWL